MLATTPTFVIEDDGRPAQEILAAIKSAGLVDEKAEEIISFVNEPVPSPGTAYHLVGLPGVDFFDAERTTERILARGARLHYKKPLIRAGLLLREKMIQKALGYAFVGIMNTVVTCQLSRRPSILGLYEAVEGKGLSGYHADASRPWCKEGLFIFLAPTNGQQPYPAA